MVSDPVRMSQGEDQVGELALLEFGDKLLVLLVGELAGIVFKDSLGSLATGCVEENDRGNIVPVWLGDAGYLLGQDPHGDSIVPGAESEIDKLPSATLNIFRRGAVVEYEQGVGAREVVAGQPQPVLDLMLQAHDHKDVRIAIHEAFVGLVLDKGGAEEHNVVKLALKGSPQLVKKILCFTGIGGPHNQGVEGKFSWVHYTLVLVLEGRALERAVFVFLQTISPWVLRVARVSGKS